MERAFRGVWIMAEVWMDERLNALDKTILAEVDSLDNEDGCYASNQYLAQFCQCTERKVSQSITKLVELGYIRRESFDGRTRILRSNLPKTARQTGKNFQADQKKIPPINIDDNQQLLSKDKSKRFVKPTLQEVIDYVREKGYRFDPEEFFYKNEAKGWKIGSTPMQNWHAACVTWEKNVGKYGNDAREVTDDASAKFRGL